MQIHTIYKLIIDETHDFHKVVSKEDGLKFRINIIFSFYLSCSYSIPDCPILLKPYYVKENQRQII